MSRRRRSFLGRDDMDFPDEKEVQSGLPEPYVPPEPKPPEEDDALSDTDLEFDLQLPESMDEQIPGFFDWDGGDGLEEPPTEEVPTPPMDSWTDDFSTPLAVPEAPPMDGILDGTPSGIPAYTEDLDGSDYDNFEQLFELPEPPKKPRQIAGLHTQRLILFMAVAIFLGLGLGGGLAFVLYYWSTIDDTGPRPPTPVTVPVKNSMGGRVEPPRVEPPAKAPVEATRSTSSVAPAPRNAKKKGATMGTVKVRLKGGVQADVWVDGSFYGLAPINVALSPGMHAISVVPVGREDMKKNVEVEVEAGKIETLEVSL